MIYVLNVVGVVVVVVKEPSSLGLLSLAVCSAEGKGMKLDWKLHCNCFPQSCKKCKNKNQKNLFSFPLSVGMEVLRSCLILRAQFI